MTSEIIDRETASQDSKNAQEAQRREREITAGVHMLTHQHPTAAAGTPHSNLERATHPESFAGTGEQSRKLSRLGVKEAVKAS